MSVGLFLAAAMLAQTADAAAAPPVEPAEAYGPAEPAPPKVAAGAEPARKDCSPKVPDPNSDTIIVCVEKSDGYRIDPDILTANKAKREAEHGRPLSRAEHAMDTATPVGPPRGCPMGLGCVNLLGVALTAAQIAARASKGEDVASVFKTDPHMSEYQYYQLAKHEREKAESEAADRAYAAQLDAEAAAKGDDPKSAEQKQAVGRDR